MPRADNFPEFRIDYTCTPATSNPLGVKGCGEAGAIASPTAVMNAVIDEIGTELEAAAARTIAERGVQLVGTAHGTELENLIKNPTITDLIGGVQYVTLGDEEAKRSGSSNSILERKAPPTFEDAVEIHDTKTWIIHENIEQSVDLLLQGQTLP